ncbi:MAG TPA: hypothetical protein VGC91_18490 [Pyrinomonadaceae bacterium]|jgi:hypothetical protein
MAKKKAEKKGSEQSNTRQAGATNPRPARFERISKSSSQIVKDAAVLLDDELASGIVAAKQMQQRFQQERRINPGDFKESLQRFQGDAHEVVNLLNDQFSELRSEENTEIIKRFTNNTHNLLDLVVEMINMGAEIADQLVQSNLPKKQGAGNGPRSS